jgi:hypothetical protein
MGWGFRSSWGGGSKKKKKATKSYSHWFERLTTDQLKALLVAARLPVSGPKAKQMDRLLQCPSTSMFAAEHEHHWSSSHKFEYGHHLSVEDLKDRCRSAKLSPGGAKYNLVLRLVEHANKMSTITSTEQTTNKRPALATIDTNKDDSPAQKKARISDPSLEPVSSKSTRKPMEGEALEKRVTFRRLKLNKQIDDRLEWKSSFRYMNGQVKGGRVDIDCPEPEVFLSMFDETHVKKTSAGKLTRTFQTDEAICDANLFGKSYRFGATANLMAPASASLNNGKLSFSFKYTVVC